LVLGAVNDIVKCTANPDSGNRVALFNNPYRVLRQQLSNVGYQGVSAQSDDVVEDVASQHRIAGRERLAANRRAQPLVCSRSGKAKTNAVGCVKLEA